MTYTPPVRSLESRLVNHYAPMIQSTGSVTIPYEELPEKLSELCRRFHGRAKLDGYKVTARIGQHGYVVRKV